jgi:hypothetical protein
MAEISVYDAVEEMRAISNKGGTFSFSFMTYSSSKGKSEGIRHFDKVQLRRRASAEDDLKNKDILLFFTDTNTDELRRCYYPLIMTFNGQTCKLK